jgi:uncharacterized integral membrane protein
MKTLYSFLFLIFFILTTVLIVGNTQYVGEFFFLAPFEGQPLSLPFLGFALLGMACGIFLLLSLRAMLSRSKKPTVTEDSSSF